MAAPEAPLQVCVLVSYPNGLASSTGQAPNIGVYALVDPADENDSGIQMRVERCQGASCAGFGFRGNSAGLQFVGGGTPQAEYIDAGSYGTIYRYRVRMENDDGESAWSSTVEVDTTVNGTSACDSGTIADLTEQLKTFGGHVIAEYTNNRDQTLAGHGIVEFTNQRVEVIAGVCILEYYDDGGGDPPPTPQSFAGHGIIEYWASPDDQNQVEDPDPEHPDPDDPGPTDDSHCLCP